MTIEPPRPKEERSRTHESDRDNRANARWRRPYVRHIRHEKEPDKCGKRAPADRVTRPRGARVYPHPGREHHHFDSNRRRNRVPQSKAKFDASGIDRHVRPVGHPIEHPMAHDQYRGDDKHPAIVDDPGANQAEEDSHRQRNTSECEYG